MIESYFKSNPSFAAYNKGIEDDGYRLEEVSAELTCGMSHRYFTKRLAKIVIFCDDELSIVFPYHDLVIGGSPNVSVMFPANWACPYKFSGYGVIATTHVMYGS